MADSNRLSSWLAKRDSNVTHKERECERLRIRSFQQCNFLYQDPEEAWFNRVYECKKTQHALRQCDNSLAFLRQFHRVEDWIVRPLVKSTYGSPPPPPR